MEIFSKAFGTLQMENGTELIYDGQYLDPCSFGDPNDIVGLSTPEFTLHGKLGIITFTDAQNIRLFMGHNKMLLEHKLKIVKMVDQHIIELTAEIDSYKYQLDRLILHDNQDQALVDYYNTAISQCEARLADY